MKDVKTFIWGSQVEVKCYDELSINIKSSEGDKFKYGNLDWVLVRDINKNDFCGVEIQSDGTTGTGKFKKAIDDLKRGALEPSYGFGLNTLASFKGFLPQFIFKGQLFDDWKKPYCAVIQASCGKNLLRNSESGLEKLPPILLRLSFSSFIV